MPKTSAPCLCSSKFTVHQILGQYYIFSGKRLTDNRGYREEKLDCQASLLCCTAVRTNTHSDVWVQQGRTFTRPAKESLSVT